MNTGINAISNHFKQSTPQNIPHTQPSHPSTYKNTNKVSAASISGAKANSMKEPNSTLDWSLVYPQDNNELSHANLPTNTSEQQWLVVEHDQAMQCFNSLSTIESTGTFESFGTQNTLNTQDSMDTIEMSRLELSLFENSVITIHTQDSLPLEIGLCKHEAPALDKADFQNPDQRQQKPSKYADTEQNGA